MAAQYAIMRFKKYKGPEISPIEAHNERTKESYASNPDIDTSRSHLNFHLIEPQGRYRTEAEKQIAEAGCRTRKDSIRLVEVLFTASPEFFQCKKKKDVKEFFQEALSFLESRQNPNTIISAVVHMDEKTPHMHLSFVPLTEDGRLSAKDIVGNKKKLTQWQDEFWEHMVEKYPDLERGQSASETGRNHIPPRLFKQMTRLTKQKEKIDALISDANFFNSKGKIDEVAKLLDKYIPAVAKMDTELKKYRVGYAQLERKNKSLEKQNERLTEQLEEEQHESILKKMEDMRLRRDYDAAVALLDRIPKEVLDKQTGRTGGNRHMNYNDEWNGMADFLAGIIEKYAEKMDLDNLPDPDKYYKMKQIKEMYTRYMRLSARKRTA